MTTRLVQNDEFGVRIAVRDRGGESQAPLLWPSVGEYGVYDDVLYYIMTSDEVRNRAYETAIEALAPGKVVLDIGTGRDMNWALAAARAGATKVYAIEELESSFADATAELAELPERDVVVLVPGRSTEVELPERVDVCVSEIIGMIGSSEGVLASLKDARARFLKPGGRMIPHRCITRVAAVTLPQELHDEPGFDRSTVGYVQQVFGAVGKAFDVRLCIGNFPASHLLSDSKHFEELELDGEIRTAYELESTLRIEKSGRLDGLLCWIELLTLASGERIDALANSTNWLPVFLPLWYPGTNVTVGDVIHVVARTSLSTNAVNPDYRIDATLESNAARNERHFESLFRDGGFRETPYYARLFPTT